MTPQDATGADLTASRASEAARVDRSGERPTEPLAGSGRRCEHPEVFDEGTPFVHLCARCGAYGWRKEESA